jgi:subtilisin family serine protease
MITAFLLIFTNLFHASAAEPPYTLPGFQSDATTAETKGAGRYIIKFDDPPLALYSGGIEGLAATRPASAGRDRLNLSSPASLAYREHLKRKRNHVQEKIERKLGRPLKVFCSYELVFNGVSAALNAEEVAAVKKTPGVDSVKLDALRHLHTDAGPEWIDAPALWFDDAGTCGEGVVIGVIDTGINPENPSFADIGGDGYDHDNPKSHFFGVCDPAHPDYDSDFPCNDKLIGAYDFTALVPEAENFETPWDVDGHGSHTASTAAGNFVADAAVTAPTTILTRNISGVAPHANLISYRGIRSQGSGYMSVLVAAIEQAVIDGVDVINYSIGGSANDPWMDMDSEAFLAARQAGVFVATSAGNDGPDPASMKSPGNAPWLLTVGASTHDRRFSASLSGLTKEGGDSLDTIVGQSISGGYGPAPIVYAGNYPNPDDPDNDPGLCLEPYPAGTFNGEIVICDRGEIARVEKGKNVLQGGAGGYVLANDAENDRSINADAHYLPAVHITYADGVALKNWLDSGSDHTAVIIGTTFDIDAAHGDVMAAFSSRGENGPLPGIIKPDVIAPGADILAAGGTLGEVAWESMSGTSMASPHAAGAAALIMARHPSWTPAEIQSALMSTAVTAVMKEDGASSADPLDMGAGRLDLLAADLPGIVLDESYENFLAANPVKGGDPATLNLASLGQDRCVFSTTWSRTLKSVSDQEVLWTTSVSSPFYVELTAEPSTFSLSPGETQSITIHADAGLAPFDEWHFGQVTLTPDVATVSDARFPVAVKAAVSSLPESVLVKDAQSMGEQTITGLAAIEITDLTSTRFGLFPADVIAESLYQDPTPYKYLGQSEYSPADGVYLKKQYIYEGNRRLVYEIMDTTSTDLDIYVHYHNGTEWELIHENTAIGSDIYFNIDTPPEGWYYVYIQNYAASDPSGGVADRFTLAITEVPNTDSCNMTVTVGDGNTHIPAGEPFGLNIGWAIDWTRHYWYGAFQLGSDAGNPFNLGVINVNIVAAFCEADSDGDGDTDGIDLSGFAGHYEDTDCPGGCPGDFDHNGIVDEGDLVRLAADYGRLDCP